jgi:diphosphomevalonate decarboxylase
MTSVLASKTFSADQFWLNGKETELNGRAHTVLKAVRLLAEDKVDAATGEVIVKKADWPQYHVHISSVNTFPTGAGLASSAAGLACLVSTLVKVYNAKESYPGEFSTIARQGSGSASRSLYGGFVRWQKGQRPDATDSIAIQVADENYWPEMRAVICVVSDKEKDTSSTYGMETSKKTSPLLNYRATTVVEPRLAELEAAFMAKDFENFGRLTMMDSNQFHAVCMDTYPPIFYMNDTSKAVIHLVHMINRHFGNVRAAYTFDAGPNAVIYCLEKDAAMIMAVMTRCFPAVNSPEEYCNKPDYYRSCHSTYDSLVPADLAKLIATYRAPRAGDVNYMFYTKPGPGPQTLEGESLLDLNGQPVEAGPKHRKLVIPSASPIASATSTVLDFFSQPGVNFNDRRSLALFLLPVVGFLAFRALTHCKCPAKGN